MAAMPPKNSGCDKIARPHHPWHRTQIPSTSNVSRNGPSICRPSPANRTEGTKEQREQKNKGTMRKESRCCLRRRPDNSQSQGEKNNLLATAIFSRPLRKQMEKTFPSNFNIFASERETGVGEQRSRARCSNRLDLFWLLQKEALDRGEMDQADEYPVKKGNSYNFWCNGKERERGKNGRKGEGKVGRQIVVGKEKISWLEGDLGQDCRRGDGGSAKREAERREKQTHCRRPGGRP